MSLRERYRLDELANVAEEFVIAELERALIERGILGSQTQESILDMAAFALNKVRPFYRTSLLGRLYGQAATEDYQDDVKAAVSEAINKIVNGQRLT